MEFRVYKVYEIYKNHVDRKYGSCQKFKAAKLSSEERMFVGGGGNTCL